MGKFHNSFTHSQDLPILAVCAPGFTHFPQRRLGKMRESVCPSHLLTHRWSLSQRLYSLLWRKAWKSISKQGKDKWRSKASGEKKIRLSNDACLPLFNSMVLNHLKISWPLNRFRYNHTMCGLILLCLIRFFFFLRGVPAEVILTGKYLAKAFDLLQKQKSKEHREIQGRCEEMSHEVPAWAKKGTFTEIILGAGGVRYLEMWGYKSNHILLKRQILWQGFLAAGWQNYLFFFFYQGHIQRN